MNTAFHVETPYQGRLFKVQVLSRSDAQGQEVRREVVRHPGAVLVIPVLNESNIILIRNHRVAVGERLWEFPAGKLEPGEQPQDAALRELEEETGYRCTSIRALGQFYTSPGFTDELMHVFVAEELTFVGQRLESGEEIEVVPMSVQAVLDLISSGEFRDGKSIAGLLMWCHQTQRSGPQQNHWPLRSQLSGDCA